MRNLFRKPKKSVFKFITIIFAGLLLVFAANYYINYKYSLITDDFFSKFNSCDFTAAKDIITDDNIYLKLKKKTLNKDLNTYFSSVVKNLCDSVLDNEDSKSKALVVLNEIKSYNILNSSLNKVIISLDDTYIPESDSDYKAILDLALDNYNNGDFDIAINLLNKIPDSSKYYSDATNYIEKCITDYKDNLFKEADDLVKDDYYTKAINLLSNADTSIITEDDADINNKIDSIAEAKENYLASIGANDSQNSTLTSNQLLQSITSSNINTLNIESLTPYLIYVNLSEQMTYVYKGTMNKWDTIKSFTCSTGIDDEKTPTGIFDVRERGDWFFSDKYQQGGKYWVQFYGDYLFHSVPYNEDQSEVVDNTLGTPASHGCIRLKTNDAKWIYDNIEAGTKVIIN
ncbi:L,D-transpeptidase family protein [Clostridium cuniculi]|uniref:L,D-transpeptidase family protein n=1 Tax=Clostridium cuniculi TaxID=2548455 RepID=UPI0018AA61C6|nr:L,D-transpeptidase family protein [Clostridium cuniculi]